MRRRAPFWFLCGYGALIALIVARWLPETRPADTLRVKGLPLAQYVAILRQPRFLASANAGALGMVLTYVSLAPQVLMTEVTMLLGALLLLAGMQLFPLGLQTHWALYMLPVAVSVAALAFTVGPATSYALEPYQQQAGVAAALQGFIQMEGGAAGSLLIVMLPVAEKSALALLAWRCSSKMHGSLTVLK
nr:UDP-glucose:undecaprenyl-phosphate glucose-1-phosphatetransferase [Candidatus Pantoea persica]